MELVNLIGLIFIINLALAQNLPYVIKKVCINNECKNVIAIDKKKLYGYDPELRQNVLKILGIGIAIAVLALIIYIAFKLAS